MADFKSARAFMLAEVEVLEPFDFVAASESQNPLFRVEIVRGEDGGLEVGVAGRPAIFPPLSTEICDALKKRGLTSERPDDSTEPWRAPAESASAAVDQALEILSEVFEVGDAARIDVVHGNYRATHEARKLLSELRERIERVLADEISGAPEQDPEGDYLLSIGDVQVVVAPRILPNGPAVVRVFAVTNVDINVVPELGLFLARMNFNLMFGRFALDGDRRTILFDEALLGNPLNDDALRFTIRVVAQTADAWDDRLKQMFGGATYQEVLKQKGVDVPPPAKPGGGDIPEHVPGQGLYL